MGGIFLSTARHPLFPDPDPSAPAQIMMKKKTKQDMQQ